MNTSLLIVLLISICILILISVSSKLLLEDKSQKQVEYISKNYLLTKAEQTFFNLLLENINADFYVATQVHLADVVRPREKKDIGLLNRIARKHLDFVIIEKRTSKILMAIELDDKSHSRDYVSRRDQAKNYALKNAGINLVRVNFRWTGDYDLSFLESINGLEKEALANQTN